MSVLCFNRFSDRGWLLIVSLLLALLEVPYGFAGEGGQAHSAGERPWLFDKAAQFAGPISTDRPSFSLGPNTVPPGRFQIEAGYTFSFEQAHPNVKTHSLPETLVRIGLIDGVELRVEWPTWTILDNGTRRTSLRDLALGMKVSLFPQQGYRPQVSLAGRLSVPTGDNDVSSDRVDPEFRTILAYAFTERVGVFSNINLAVPTSQGTRFVQGSSSLGVSAVMVEGLTGFAEYFGFYPRDVAQGSGHFLQTGVLFLLTDHLQWDLRIGAGLTHGTDDVFTGTGLSWRF